jgi:glutathione-regulated potassium-efflux system ancillary protein KefG
LRILILFAHPAVQKSRINRRLCDTMRDLPGVTHHDLYQHYPEYDIDVPAEQRLLLEHDVIAFQHPLFWYSVPALLKEWLDLVLEHGWAYGSRGSALEGKLCLNLVSCGGGQAAYAEGGFNRMGVRRLLAPVENTARLCRMHYLAPFVIHGTHSIPEAELDAHCADLRRILGDLHHGRLDLETAGGAELLNGCPALGDEVVP